MTDRMQKITETFARQAGITWQDQPELGVWTAFDEELTQFAELIVRECVGKYDEWAEHSTDKTSFAMARHNVKKHFGIEE